MDGEVSWSSDDPVSDTEQFLVISTECDGYRGKDAKPAEALRQIRLPDDFLVDFIRIYDEVPE